MKKLFYACLALLCCFTCVTRASAQGSSFMNFDSLKTRLSVQRTAMDSVKILQQMADVSFPLDDISAFGAKPDYVEQLLALNKRVKLIDPVPYQLIQKAKQYQLSKQYREQLNTLKLAVNEFDKQHKNIMPLLVYIRLLFNQLKDQETKVIYFRQKLEYYQINGPVENTAACFHGIAGYYLYKAAYNQSCNNYLKAADVFRKFNQRFYANEMMVVGNTYHKWGNEDKAVYYIKKLALPLQAKLKDSNRMSFCEEALGEIYFRKHQYRDALTQFNRAIAQLGNKRDNSAYGNYTVDKGEAYIKLGKPDSAFALLNQAQAIADSRAFQLQNTNGNMEIDFVFYEYYLREGKTAEAEKHLLAANKKAAEEKSTELRLKYLKELGDFYKAQHKLGPAISYYDQYFDLHLLNEREQDEFKVAQFEIDRKDQQQQAHISQLKQEKALQDYQIGRRNILLWGSLVVLVLISGLLIFIYRQLRFNKKTLRSLRKTQRQLIQSEKMASLGELTAGIAHEIQNPLNFVNNFSEVNTEMIDELEVELKAGNIEEALVIAADLKQNEQKISHHGKRADGIVKGMLQHSQAGSGSKEPTNINALADEFMRLAYHGLRAKDKSFNAVPIAIGMTNHFDKNLPQVNVVAQDIGRVLLNLYNNAFYAVHQKQKSAGPDYKPEVSITTSSQNGRVTIKVKDNGTGIPDAIKDKIMQPFFTTKPTGEGTGLGLSLTYDMVVKGHGGSITVNTKEGEFTEFVVTLPLNK